MLNSPSHTRRLRFDSFQLWAWGTFKSRGKCICTLNTRGLPFSNQLSILLPLNSYFMKFNSFFFFFISSQITFVCGTQIRLIVHYDEKLICIADYWIGLYGMTLSALNYMVSSGLIWVCFLFFCLSLKFRKFSDFRAGMCLDSGLTSVNEIR